ncbi:hypothetical protein ACOSP7_031803 [Xanthoceras sorbifolium]
MFQFSTKFFNLVFQAQLNQEPGIDMTFSFLFLSHPFLIWVSYSVCSVSIMFFLPSLHILYTVQLLRLLLQCFILSEFLQLKHSCDEGTMMGIQYQLMISHL